jgi:hypothetical protein
MSTSVITADALNLETATPAQLRVLEGMPQFRPFVLDFKRAKRAEVLSREYEVTSLGGFFTIPQIAQAYQAFKGMPKSAYESEQARKDSFAYAVSTECLSIIKGLGLNAGWEDIVELINA